MHFRTLLLVPTLLSVTLTGCLGQAPMTQEEVRAVAQQWYALHGEGYHLQLTPENATATVANIYREAEGVHDQLVVEYQGMELVLAFAKDLRTLPWTTEAFNEHFSYLTFTDIPLGLPVYGWTLHPRVPVSSAGKEVITFDRVDDQGVTFTIRWETYTVGGYSQNEFCQERMQWTDTATPSDCLVFVDRRVPLRVEVTLDRR